MKLSSKSFSVFVPLMALSFFACREAAEKKNLSEASASLVLSKPSTNEKYVVDKKESVVTWKGAMAIGSGAHVGYVYISKGELMVEKDQLAGGLIEVDMTTIADKDHGSDNGLVDHLKSSDFFDVAKFPTAAFAIVKVAAVNAQKTEITGVLTIKGISHTVTFPSKVEFKDGVLHAIGKMTIDRTEWDVRYKSGKFYDDLADEAISDKIEFDMKIVARK